MTNQKMYEASLRRPENYADLPGRRQWEIDAELGILDWDGSQACKHCAKDFTPAGEGQEACSVVCGRALLEKGE